MAGDMLDIERPLKAGEGVRVGGRGAQTYMDIFLTELHALEQDFTKQHKPFDRACARIDFEDRYEKVLKEIDRTEGSVNMNDTRLKIDFGDLKSYGKIERLTRLGDAEDMVTTVKDGMNVPILVGYTEFFTCPRGHRIAVSVPIDEWRKRLAISQ